MPYTRDNKETQVFKNILFICVTRPDLSGVPLTYSELDSFGSSTVPGHLRINIFIFSRMSKYTDLSIIQSFSQIY